MPWKAVKKKRANSPYSYQPPPDRDRGRRWLRRLAIFSGLFGLLLVYVNIADRHECVEMPSGLLIGRATVFSEYVVGKTNIVSRWFGGPTPDMAIRFPDGRLLRRGDGEIEFLDRESVGGDYPGTFRHRHDH